MESDSIDLEPMRRPGEQRLHDGVHLCAARRPLRCRRRRVGQYGKAAEAHRHRLVAERAHHRRRREIELIFVRAGVLQDEHVNGRDPAVCAEADLDARHQRRTVAADVVFFLAADAHHHRTADLPRQERWDGDRIRARNLAAEATAGVFADDDDLLGLDADPQRHRFNGAHHTLRRAVEKEFSILPVGHRGPRFERLMARRLRMERVVEDESRLLKAGAQIAVRPLNAGLARRHLAFGSA